MRIITKSTTGIYNLSIKKLLNICEQRNQIFYYQNYIQNIRKLQIAHSLQCFIKNSPMSSRKCIDIHGKKMFTMTNKHRIFF